MTIHKLTTDFEVNGRLIELQGTKCIIIRHVTDNVVMILTRQGTVLMLPIQILEVVQ